MSSAPSPVRMAVKLMYGLVALAVIGLTRLPFQVEGLRLRLTENAAPGTADVDALVSRTVMVSIAVGVIPVVLWTWLATNCARGRNWARITASVLDGLVVVGAAVSLLLMPVGLTLSLLISVVVLGLVVAMLFLLWQPASGLWFHPIPGPDLPPRAGANAWSAPSPTADGLAAAAHPWKPASAPIPTTWELPKIPVLFGAIALSMVLEVSALVVVAGKPSPRPVGTAEARTAVQAWKDVNSGYYDTVGVDLQAVVSAADSGSEPDTIAACESMNNHLQTARAAPPVPASDVNDAWQGFLINSSQGVKLWAEGLRRHDTRQIQAGTAAIEEGNSFLKKLNEDLARDG